MKIKMLTNVVHACLIRTAGTIHEIEDGAAQSLIKRGLAKLAPSEDAPAPPKAPAKAGK
jgi:hypothetical protein